MKNFSLFVFCIWFSTYALGMEEKSGKQDSTKVSVPKIYLILGQVEFQHGREKVYSKAQLNTRMVEQGMIRTFEKSRAEVEFANGLKVILEENTEIEIPGIQWEDGYAPQIILRQGEIEWLVKNDCEVRLTTGLSSLKPCQGEYVFKYSPTIPRVDASVYKGEIEFSATHAEKTVQLKDGQKAHFIGILEDGEIALDILLNKKKIPRGQLSEVEKMTEAEVRKREELVQKKKLEVEKKRQAQIKKVIEEDRVGQICKNPSGKFNECLWIKQAGVGCVRKRCNANGVWADPMPITGGEAATACSKKYRVGICNY